MTKREFTIAYVLKHVTPESRDHEIRAVIFNAQYVWAEIQKSADAEDDD